MKKIILSCKIRHTIFISLIIFHTILSHLQCSAVNLEHKRIIKILSIDGGGVRGIIPALMLKHIESRLPRNLKLSQCFDVIAGTSAGGIIALMLSVPNNENKPKYSASEIVDIYENFSKGVFSQSFWQWLRSADGFFNAKYSCESLEKYLDLYFGQLHLRDCLTNIIIPAYEIELDKTFFFKSSRAKSELSQDCFLKDLARATSAAPTYFSPAHLTDGTGKRYLHFIDGGVGVNNPTIAAVMYAFEMFGEDIELFVVSLGTGTNYGAKTKNINAKNLAFSGLISWAPKIISTMMYASNDITNYEMHYTSKFIKKSNYFRFQPIIESEHTYMDNASNENIESLKQYAYDLIIKNQNEIEEIIYKLSNFEVY